jgi:hypothetical protein
VSLGEPGLGVLTPARGRRAGELGCEEEVLVHKPAEERDVPRAVGVQQAAVAEDLARDGPDRALGPSAR